MVSITFSHLLPRSLTLSIDCYPRSEEALELSQNIKKLGLNKDICSREYLFKFF